MILSIRLSRWSLLPLMAYQVSVSAPRRITLWLHHGTIRYCLWFIHINGTHGQCTRFKWTILHILRWLAFCAKSSKLSWVKVMFFYEVAKNLWDVAHLAHVTCYMYLGIWNMQVRCWEIQSNGGSVPKAAISHDHPVRFKIFFLIT